MGGNKPLCPQIQFVGRMKQIINLKIWETKVETFRELNYNSANETVSTRFNALCATDHKTTEKKGI